VNEKSHPLAIKVTDGDHKSYFVYFDRDTHELMSVFEYKQIYTPGMGRMSNRNQTIVDLAKSRIGMALEMTGAKQ
jgi:hypothetical protein